jgi:hypothetical protein
VGDTFQLSNSVAVTFEGTIADPGATPGDVLTIQSDRSIAAESGGGSSPETETLSAGPFSALMSGESAPDWEQDEGSDLVDLTTPDIPTLIAAGIYLVTYAFTIPSDVAFLLPVTYNALNATFFAVPPDGTASGADTSAACGSEVGSYDAGRNLVGQLINPNASDLAGCSLSMTVTKLG